MSLESSDQDNPFKALQELKGTSFSELLMNLLESKGSTRRKLLAYADLHEDVDFQHNTLYRYFNGHRAPRGKKGELFLRLLADHLELNKEERELLQLAVWMRRKRLMRR